MYNIELNGLKYLDHTIFFVGDIGMYFVIVFTQDIRTGHNKEYAKFIAESTVIDEPVIIKVMEVGFEPNGFSNWMHATLLG